MQKINYTQTGLPLVSAEQQICPESCLFQYRKKLEHYSPQRISSLNPKEPNRDFRLNRQELTLTHTPTQTDTNSRSAWMQ